MLLSDKACLFSISDVSSVPAAWRVLINYGRRVRKFIFQVDASLQCSFLKKDCTLSDLVRLLELLSENVINMIPQFDA